MATFSSNVDAVYAAFAACSAACTTPQLTTKVAEPESAGGFSSRCVGDRPATLRSRAALHFFAHTLPPRRSYVTYLVRTQPLNFIVRRRYSDFLWLRGVLVKRYAGMLIPSLPAKSATGTSTVVDSKFVLDRVALIHVFMTRIVNIPFLRSDATVLYFLEAQNGKVRVQVETPRSTPAVPALPVHPLTLPPSLGTPSRRRSGTRTSRASSRRACSTSRTPPTG